MKTAAFGRCSTSMRYPDDSGDCNRIRQRGSAQCFCEDVKFIILITSRQHHHYEVTKSTVASLMFMSTKTIVNGSTTHTVASPIARLVRQWPGSVVSIIRATVRIDSILAYVAAGACPSEHYLAVNTVGHVALTQLCLTFVFAIKGKCI